MEFLAGTSSLKCPYCNWEKQLVVSQDKIDEQPYLESLQQLDDDKPRLSAMAIECSSCGAQTILPNGQTAGACAFCGLDLIIQGASTQVVKPQGILPFAIDKTQAKQHYTAWLSSRWFLPSGFASRIRQQDKIKGVYIPCWTFDTEASSYYTGFRGEDYWATETYTAVVNGQHVTRTRQVLKTNWYPSSGNVFDAFDDVTVPASRSLPEKEAQNLTPWSLQHLVPFSEDYLSGFFAEQYAFDFRIGFEKAKQIMQPRIRANVRSDIGGDRQRITSLNTAYDATSFKHVLLPTWIAAYRYLDKVYQVLINASTGEVQGQRPWSWFKITFTAILVLCALAGIAHFLAQP
jgi:DNA-directed RNA polymerase subunit RPC12/RpoP